MAEIGNEAESTSYNHTDAQRKFGALKTRYGKGENDISKELYTLLREVTQAEDKDLILGIRSYADYNGINDKG